MYYYVYVLLSDKDGNFYTGYTDNINARIKLHNNMYYVGTFPKQAPFSSSFLALKINRKSQIRSG